MGDNKIVLRTLKLSEEDNQRLREDAHAHNMNVSEYLRWLIFNERTHRCLLCASPKPVQPILETDDHTVWNIIDS